MAAIHDLIRQIDDVRLRERIASEWAAASRQRKFGLVFERHLPELLPMHGIKPKRGDLVCRKQGSLSHAWRVRKVSDGIAECVCTWLGETPAQLAQFSVGDLVVVRQFGEPIFPSLSPVDAVANGPAEGPWHTLIEADNYHALQLLDYLYAGQVDCIYIDPPYNTGARDWKYNNDYVDANDGWRHSKWLAFMERRLRLAKRLLKPDSGVLIVTIDEHEVHHLGMLLEQLFPEFFRQMVTIVINPKGTGKLNFARVEEHAIFCIPNVERGVIGRGREAGEDDESEGSAGTVEDLVPDPVNAHLWEHRHARRRGSESSYRPQRPNQFYPIYIDEKQKLVVRSGPSIPLGQSPKLSKTKDGLTPIWPIDHDRNERCWRVISSRMQELIDAKRVVLGKFNKKRGTWTINLLYRKSVFKKLKTVWWETNHDAGTHGTTFLHSVLGLRGAFAFPKSIYAARDCLAAVVQDRPNALIVDFFAGSGTTLNSVNLLNAADGGRRRCVLVTNNEVSADEASRLVAQGRSPGDPEWEALGICRSVTWPRSKFTMLGKRDDGSTLSGDYATDNTLDVLRSRSFTQIGFVDPAALSTPARRKQLLSLVEGLPQSLVKDDSPFIVSEDYDTSVLFDPDAANDWLAALDDQDHITKFFIVAPTKKFFDQLKARIGDLLGPATIVEDERRPLSAGFDANLAYFKLGFLDKDRVALRRAFKEILPLLWLKSGAMGTRPELPSGQPEPAAFAPKGANFAVLLDETKLTKFLKEIASRSSLSHLFLVTDADESFKSMSERAYTVLGRANPRLQVFQLYRDYLSNFLINARLDDPGADSGAASEA